MIPWIPERRRVVLPDVLKPSHLPYITEVLDQYVGHGEPVEFFMVGLGGDNEAMEELVAVIEDLKRAGSVVRMLARRNLASAHVPVFGSGTRGERYIWQDTDVMLHATQNHYDIKDVGLYEMRATLAETEAHMARYVAILARNTGQSIAWWDAKIAESLQVPGDTTPEKTGKGQGELHVDAHQALQWGLADKVVGEWPKALSLRREARSAA